jgi:hypothetical protein
LSQEYARASATPPEAPTVWFHGGRSYSRDGLNPFVVNAEQHNLLQAFLARDVALPTRELEDAGVSNVSRVVGTLLRTAGGALADAIRRPKAKGEGYFIRVRDLADR